MMSIDEHELAVLDFFPTLQFLLRRLTIVIHRTDVGLLALVYLSKLHEEVHSAPHNCLLQASDHKLRFCQDALPNVH